MNAIRSSARSPSFVWSGLVVLTALMFVWPLQHTIALRYWLLGFGLIWSLVGWFSYRRTVDPGRVPFLALLMLVLLTVWMYIGAFGWALAPDKTLREIAGQWLIPLVSFGIGLSAAYLLPDHRRLLARLLFIVLAVNVWALVGLDVIHAFLHGGLLRRYGGLESINPLAFGNGSPDKANYLTNIYSAFLLAELVQLRAKRERILGLGYTLIGLFFAVGLVAQYIEDMRNGIVALGLMIVLSIGLFIVASPRERRGRDMAVACVVLVLGVVSLGYMLWHQQRWRTLMATVPIALNTTHNREWLTGGLPKLPDGQVASASNYQRIAWAKEAVVVLMHYPFGVGFQRQAFGSGVDAIDHTTAAQGNHSHSGILDLADGVGLPGLALWVVFVASIWVSALLAFRQRMIAPATVVLLVVFDYSARSVVDSILRDHMLQQFMFLAAFFASWTAIEWTREGGE